MSNISNFFSPSKKDRREFITGPGTRTWPVPPGVSEVEVHVWGGGGNGTGMSGGGGGGGYSRARLNVTPTDSLSITVGGAGEISYVSVPTQCPSACLSLFGGAGSAGGAAPTGTGGAGGVGIATLSPTQPQVYCFSASGGAGGNGCCQSPNCAAGGGGGSAGSPRGNGKIGGAPGCTGGGTFMSTSGATILQDGSKVCLDNVVVCATGFVDRDILGSQPENDGGYDPNWFYVDDNMAGSGGAGGGGYSYVCGPGGTYLGKALHAKDGGFLAGGGGGTRKTSPTYCFCAYGGNGGIAGGGGGNGHPTGTLGGPGAVIIYY